MFKFFFIGWSKIKYNLYILVILLFLFFLILSDSDGIYIGLGVIGYCGKL